MTNGLCFVVGVNDNGYSHADSLGYHHGEDGLRWASSASMPQARPARPNARPRHASTETSNSQIQDVPHSEIQRLPRKRNATKAAGRVNNPKSSRIPREISVIACMGAAKEA